MVASPGLALSVAQSHPAAMDILAAFVAINTLMYVCLAILKLLPRIRLPKVMRRRYSRAESRSIYPPKPPKANERDLTQGCSSTDRESVKVSAPQPAMRPTTIASSP